MTHTYSMIGGYQIQRDYSGGLGTDWRDCHDVPEAAKVEIEAAIERGGKFDGCPLFIASDGHRYRWGN